VRGKQADVELQKGNILLIGPTGCGKTLLAQTLAKKLDVPFAIADATTLTEAGYVGEDVESVIKALFRNAGGDVEKTARGILCIDEIDKIARKGGVPSPTRDVSGEGVQQALLKILEGKTATITPDGARNRPQQELIQIDTTDILFICTGAFNGIEDLVRRRTGQRGMGFGAAIGTAEDDKDQLRSMVRHEDLTKFGMIPEFMGRLPIIVSCDQLDVDSLTEVLWRPKNALSRQYQRLFDMEGVKLTFTQDALKAVAEEAARRKSGARGLRAILESALLDIMFEVPGQTNVNEVIINEDVIEKHVAPMVTYTKEAQTGAG
jgi:ATP-dependent Clp protease ATP-binding subunit ClpX